MTNQELVTAAIAIAKEAEKIKPEDIFLWPDHLAPQRMRLRQLRARYEDLCEEIEVRGLDEEMRTAECEAFNGDVD